MQSSCPPPVDRLVPLHSVHNPTDIAPFPCTCRTDRELAVNIQKATNPEETAPKRKHVRSCIVYTWDNKSALAFWAGMKVYVASLLFCSVLFCCLVALRCCEPKQLTALSFSPI